MQTAKERQYFLKDGQPVSFATSVETLYFEQSYNGQTYRTSLNNRLLVVGNKLNAVTKDGITDSLNKAQIPFYYITKIKSDTASGIYRLDVSMWNIDSAVRAATVTNDISTRIADTSIAINNRIDLTNTDVSSLKQYCDDTYVPLIGGKMSGGIAFSKASNADITKVPGLCANGDNLVIACPDSGYISLWGSLSNEFGINTPGITIKKPEVTDNGKVPVYNFSKSELVWSTYNAGSLKFSTADYKKYYILGITEQSYQERDFGETTFIASEGNIETNVYVSRKNVYANAFYASSDKSLKTDIKEVKEDTYIPEIVQFTWIDTSTLSYGVIAQDLEAHGLDYLMDKDEDLNIWRVNYNAVHSLILADLQKTKKSHEERISKLEHENDELKKTIENLAKRLEKLENNK